MNELLSNKLEQLNAAKDSECWYLVKHQNEFAKQCYLTSILKEYLYADTSYTLDDFISIRAGELNEEKNIGLKGGSRSLRVAAFYGLLTMSGREYRSAVITPTFEEICQRCSGQFEKTELYQDIIDRQIEKLYLSSDLDEKKSTEREEFRLYPLMFLYKILLEMGRATGEYKISIAEYNSFVITAKRFQEFMDTLLFIKLFREDIFAIFDFEPATKKFDSRVILSLKQLSTLSIDNYNIELVPEKISEVSEKVFAFENNPELFLPDDYFEFLGSTKSLMDLDKFSYSKPPKSSSAYDFNSAKTGACNIVVYGTPGCGKSYYAEHTLLPEINAKTSIRTTFYQDYTNTDFVGQIIPKVHKNKSVTYEFNPGPFALALRAAIQKPDEAVALVIEELNRGNAPSIFGDIFQLLDRTETGKSQYGITNVNLQDYLNEYFEADGYVFEDIYIPSNLYIIATMNTSDQNVFTLDTAFKRRWNFEKLRNVFTDEHKYREYYLPGMPDVTWEGLVTGVNSYILNNSNELTSEDKQLGVYFIEKESLCKTVSECNDDIKKRKFAYKLFEYLWDDVAKFSRSDWFGSDVKSLDDLIDAYMAKGKKVFVDGIIKEQF